MESTDDSRCKFCSRCDLQVFNLIGLEPAEINLLVEENDSEICGQAFFRNDNTLSFSECKFPRRVLRGKIRPSFPSEIASRCCRAFPPFLADEVHEITHLFERYTHAPTAQDIGAIYVGDTPVRIPSRIYSEVPSEADLVKITERQRLIVACLLTRHHNGFVRQRFATSLANSLHDWTTPFAVQLLGEYVYNIFIELNDIFPLGPSKSITAFAANNPKFLTTTCRRIVSYWTYYRTLVPDFAEYPPYQILQRMGIWDHTLTPKLTAKQQ